MAASTTILSTAVEAATKRRPGWGHHLQPRGASVVVVGAHADDILVGAAHLCVDAEVAANVLDVVVTDGAGNLLPAGVATREDLVRIRIEEEMEVARRAGFMGVAMLGFTSTLIKNLEDDAPTKRIAELIQGIDTVVTHHPVDEHVTHVAVAQRVLQAISLLPKNDRPQELLGMEVWGELGWVTRERLKFFPIDDLDAVRELMTVYESQNAAQGYHDGLVGRLAANATFADAHLARRARGLVRLLDMSELIGRPPMEVESFVRTLHAEAEEARLRRLSDLLQGCPR